MFIRRRSWPLAVLIATLSLLVGCAGLPTDDSPRAGQPVLSQPRQEIQVRPEGPSQGATPEQIVRGFLLANISFADSHEVARAYLTDSLASSWVPTDNVVIHTGEPELSSLGEGVIRAQVPVQGLLDDGGQLTEVPTSDVRSEDFVLTQIDDQWRITEFPDGFGLWLSVSAFEAQYRSASVNYLSTIEDAFIPDERWFSRDDGLPTALARALLVPVPEYLEGVVRTATGEGTNLVAGAVPLDPATGTATVNLQGPGLTEEPDQVRDLYASFTSTLGQAAGVRAVQIQVNGQPLAVPGIAGPVQSVEDLGFTSTRNGPGYAVLRIAEALTAVNPDDFALRNLPTDEQEALGLPDVSSEWFDLEMNVAATEFAAVNADRDIMWRSSRETEVLRTDIGSDLSSPAFDGFDSLWVAGRSATGPRVWTIDTRDGPSGLAAALTIEWLEPQMSLDALAIAPDGHRIALVISEGEDQRLALAGVLRDEDGRPIGVTAPQTLAAPLTTLGSVTWASQDSLAVLGQRNEDDGDTPYLLPLGGWLRPLQVQDGATNLVGVPTSTAYDLFLVTGEGRVYTPEGASWFPYRNADDFIVPAGSST
ncbi:MAG: LpqB family beta-propeller domain-containing protein [Ornithinimicrobium sp.]